MIAGRVNSDLEALVELTLVNSRDGSRRTLTAVIDTGFNGFLTLHPDLLGGIERRTPRSRSCEVGQRSV